MGLKIAIYGMGVVGRELLRTLWGLDGIEVTMLCDSVSTDNLAYLLKYDTIYHDAKLRDSVQANEDGIVIGDKEIKLYTETEIRNLPLGGYGVDLVIDCSGRFTKKEQLQGFIDAGARYVMACSPLGNDVPSIAYGVNQNTLLLSDTIISFGTMETQVLASVLKVLNNEFGVRTAIAKSFRSYTNSQPTIDNYNPKDYALGRAAAWNITPTSDGFARAIGLVIPELNGKVTGYAYRAPVINGSVLDITAVLEKGTSRDGLNIKMKERNLGFQYNEDSLCSSDALSYAFPQYLSKCSIVHDCDGITVVTMSVVYDSVRGFCNKIVGFIMSEKSKQKGWAW